MGAGLLKALSEADQALGRLDGSTDMLPNPDLFVAMYVKKEAVLSSQMALLHEYWQHMKCPNTL